MLTPNLSVNENGHLAIGGVDTVDLAKQYGTPLYVMDEDMVRENCRGFQRLIDEEYEGRALICYASKALSCKEMYRVVHDEGLGADVISGGELYTALQAGMPAANIVMHGNSKTPDEIRMALENGVGRLVADNIEELARVDRIAGEMGVKANVLLRVKPGIDAHTHKFIRTGQIDSKFGFALENGEAWQGIQQAATYENINLQGLHCHIGSQIFDTEPFAEAATVMIRFMCKVRDELQITLNELNLGGGPGIRYTEKDDPPAFEAVVRTILQTVRAICSELSFPEPFILFEPGRSIVGGAGLTLYTVMARKEIKDIRNYVLVDGGMCDNPRYALYQSEYEAIVANKADQPKDDTVTIGGKCCESGDLIGEHMPLQHAVEGDILAVLATGAYNYSMASNYNRNLRPEMVMVKEGTSRTIIRRETFEDLVCCDI